MPKFAVYYIPGADDEFYRLGTYLLGYDVRARQKVSLPPDLQAQLGEINPEWVSLSHPFGFHLTITDALDCHWGTLPKIERELDDLLACFDPAHSFTLQRHEGFSVGTWGAAKKLCLALVYQPNRYLHILHTLLVARLNPLGTGSGYLQRALAHPHTNEPLTSREQQVRMFYSPTILDNWYPHFTLFNPYTGSEATQLASTLTTLFDPYAQFTIRSICLLIKPDDQVYWQMYREFPTPSLPIRMDPAG